MHQIIFRSKNYSERSPPTSPGCPVRILFDHPKDVPIWRSTDVLKWRSKDVLIWRPWSAPGKGDLGRRQDVLRTSPRWSWKHVLGTMWGHLLDIPKFLLLFFHNLFDWPNLSKGNSILKVYLEPSRTSKIELFCDIS